MLELPHIAAMLQPSRGRGLLATTASFLALLDSVLNPRPVESLRGGHVQRPDPRLRQIYRDNMELVAAIALQFHVRPIFVPQILNYTHLTGEQPGSLPFVREKDTEALMADLNKATRGRRRRLRRGFPLRSAVGKLGREGLCR